MKILLVAHFFPPERNAGAEKRALGYAVELSNRGHSVQVLCAGDWDMGASHWNGTTDDRYQGISVRRVNLNWALAEDPNRSLYDNHHVTARLAEWLLEWQPDIVHIISLITLGAGVVRAVKELAIPVVMTLTDFWMVCPKISLVRGDGLFCDGQVVPVTCLKCMMWNTKILKSSSLLLPESTVGTILAWLSRHPRLNRLRGLRGMALDMEDRRAVLSSIARSIDVVLTPSNNMGRIIDACGIFPVPARTIHSGHDLSWVSEQSAPRQNHLQRFGFIGQWIPAKGLHQIVEAFQTLKDRRYAQLFIYGNAEENSAYATALQEQVADDPQIHWMGAFPHERLGTVLNELDILIVPSQWHENNPRVIQEAFAAKVPVIASDVGGIAEFVEHGVNGLLYPHASVSALRALLERVLDEPDLVQQLKNGIKPVKTMAEEVDEIIEIYRNLVPICAVC